jgi:hypothetical protein
MPTAAASDEPPVVASGSSVSGSASEVHRRPRSSRRRGALAGREPQPNFRMFEVVVTIGVFSRNGCREGLAQPLPPSEDARVPPPNTAPPSLRAARGAPTPLALTLEHELAHSSTSGLLKGSSVENLLASRIFAAREEFLGAGNTAPKARAAHQAARRGRARVAAGAGEGPPPPPRSSGQRPR